jgi:hypothetical protein
MKRFEIDKLDVRNEFLSFVKYVLGSHMGTTASPKALLEGFGANAAACCRANARGGIEEIPMPDTTITSAVHETTGSAALSHRTAICDFVRWATGYTEV